MKAFILKIIHYFFKPMPPQTPLEPQNASPSPAVAQPVMTTQEKVYMAAKLCLGKHITLNDNVPHDVGCAEAVSYVLKAAGLPIPQGGFAGTYDLWQWLQGHATLSNTPSAGCVIISPTGTSAINSPHGHVGCLGNFGIMSNNSDSGLFTELWTLQKWFEYYRDTLKFPVYFFVFP